MLVTLTEFILGKIANVFTWCLSYLTFDGVSVVTLYLLAYLTILIVYFVFTYGTNVSGKGNNSEGGKNNG